MPGRLAGSIPVIATLVLPALGIGAPTGTARAEDCLASPNSPAPKGNWWYYRLDSPTQRKCWYLRSLGGPAKPTAERETTQPLGSGSASSELTRPSDSTDDSAPSLPAADTATVGSIVRGAITPQASPGSQTNVAIAPPTQNDASVVSANSREGKAADALRERPGQETSASSQTDAQTAGANDTEVASPDAVPRILADATSTDDAAASVPDDYVRGLPVAASRPLTSSRRYSFSLSQSP
jgi:hypothetical protein